MFGYFCCGQKMSPSGGMSRIGGHYTWWKCYCCYKRELHKD